MPTIEIHTSASSIEQLSGEWQDLLAASANDTVFLTPDWMTAWLEAQPRSVALRVMTLRGADDKLEGLIPLYSTEFRALSVIPIRALRVMGDVASGAEYGTWILRRGREAEAAAALAQALGEQRDWDVLWMPRLPTWEPVYDPMIAACRGAGLKVATRPTPFSALALPRSIEEFEASMSANGRQQLRRVERKLRRAHTIEIIDCRSSDTIDFLLETLFDLHEKRWRAVGRPGLFVRRPQERTFYERFTPLAARRGWLRGFVLKANGTPRAVQFGYVYGNVFSQLQEGFDPQFDTGAGNVLRRHVLEVCMQEGVTLYDFLGGQSEHKRRWLAQARHGADVLLGQRSWRGRALLSGPVWPTGRYISE